MVGSNRRVGIGGFSSKHEKLVTHSRGVVYQHMRARNDSIQNQDRSNDNSVSENNNIEIERKGARGRLPMEESKMEPVQQSFRQGALGI